jgi:hypothetical protein
MDDNSSEGRESEANETRDNMAELNDKLLLAIKLLDEAITCVAGIEDNLDANARAAKDK